MGEWVVGAVINLFGSIAINFGTNLLKLGHMEIIMAPPMKLLRELNETISSYKVKVKVIEKYRPRIGRNGTRYQRIKLADNQNTEMVATLFNDSIEDFQEHLTYGNQYYVSNAKIKKTEEKYKVVQHDYHMLFDERTQIELAEDHANLQQPKYLSLDQIPKHTSRESRFDVLAGILYIGQIKTVTAKYTGRICQLRKIHLIDQSNKKILLSVWEELANEECEKLASITSSTSTPVIVVTAVTSSNYAGLSLSTTPSSTFITNVQSSEAENLRLWLTKNVDSIKKTYLEITNSKQCETTSICSERKTIAELKRKTHENTLPNESVWIQCTIKAIKNKNSLIYMACKNCGKTASSNTSSSHYCITCNNENVTTEPRFVVHFDAHDETEQIPLVAFGPQAEKLLNKKANELYQLSHEDIRDFATTIESQLEAQTKDILLGVSINALTNMKLVKWHVKDIK